MPTANLSLPSTAYVGEPVIADGSGSSGVNGQVGWSVNQFSATAAAPVAMDFGDNLGPYSRSELLRATHVYLTAGTFTVSLTVTDSGGNTNSTTAQVVVSEIPAAIGGNIQTLTDQGSSSANNTALQNAINTAFAANTVEQEIRLPLIMYAGTFTIPAAAGTKYVTIRPSDVSWLPGPLTRISPGDSINMPKIATPSTDTIAITMNGGNRKYLRFLGIEFKKNGSFHAYQFIEIGNDAPSTFGALPSRVMVDRCYMHGNPLDDTARPMFIQGDYVSIINSYLTDFHQIGADAQAIAMFAGTGFGFVNNYAEGYGENILWGGSDTSVVYSGTLTGSPTTTTATFSSAPSDMAVGMPISFALGGVTTSGPGFTTASSVGYIVGGSGVVKDDLLVIPTGIIGTVYSIDTSTSPNIVTLVGNSQVNVGGGVAIQRRNYETCSIVRSVSGSTITYDPISAAPSTASNGVKYGATPQDIFVARSYFPKSLYYRVGDPEYNGSYAPVVKNAVEFKHARRAILTGNVVDYNWSGQGQSGPTVLFTVRNQSNTNPWATVRDIQYSETLLDHLPDAFNFLGHDTNSGTSGITQYIVVRNNVLRNLNGSTLGGGYGAIVVMTTSPQNITLSHNTALNLGGNEYIIADNTLTDNMLYMNNINAYENYGMFGSGGYAGDTFVSQFTTNSYFTYNVVSDDLDAKNGTPFTAPRAAPTYFPPALSDPSIFVSYPSDLHLAVASPYREGGATPAADGESMGANIDDVDTAIAHTTDGDWSTAAATTYSVKLLALAI